MTYLTDGGDGVLTVITEIGEPTHNLATSSVELWAKMDRKIFTLLKW